MGVSVYTDDAIDKIAGWLREGFSASRIADLLSAVLNRPIPRNAIVGLVHRNKRLSAIGFAHQGSRSGSVMRANSWTAQQAGTARDMWARGASAREIGVTIGRSTKSVQFYMGEHREAFPVRKDSHVASGSAGGRVTRRIRIERSAKPAEDLLPAATGTARSYDAASRRLPLADLGWRDCRFAVNDAGPGEQHLFCGLRTEPGQSWCRHHLLRCLGDGTRAERDAELALMRGRAA